jgi:hypothetical protein
VGRDNPNGPTELELVAFNDSYPLTVNNTKKKGKDVVNLNIREHMEEGKSQTWFKYVTTVLDHHYFDYIGKTDTDTLVYPSSFSKGTS